ncbi:unnamed protein product [Strongylus vulgaris]|uniref:Alpha-1,6-mannosyl-glycoprotein 2-beta-N-acetylglucosaminyltransferase n=1 Tax=Strongylus vulgaris TaxID=40348 RepID=A0A3P7KR20_STRVU|nr:unnamed protein product [Strongylus vulgaris]
MNYVFDGIYDRYALTDPWVLLLEEDHYLAPDALHVLAMIIENRKTYCEKCEIISLGFYLKSFTNYGNHIAKLGAHPWYSSKHNMGMAFRRETWMKVKNCSEVNLCSHLIPSPQALRIYLFSLLHH